MRLPKELTTYQTVLSENGLCETGCGSSKVWPKITCEACGEGFVQRGDVDPEAWLFRQRSLNFTRMRVLWPWWF